MSSSNHDEHGIDERTLLILYATETGTAQDVADRIARECRRIHFQCRVKSMDEYPASELINEHFVVFVVSTTGSGAEPRTMTALWATLLRADLPSDLFEDMDFAVFGLGDTAYEKFCWPAKKLSRRLESLGGREVCARGEGDEQHMLGIDGALDPWIEALLDTLLHLYPLPAGSDKLPSSSKPLPRVSVTDISPQTSVDEPDPVDVDGRYHDAALTRNERMTSDDWWQDVRHFEFSFKDDIHYRPGDVAVIHPVAEESEVELFLVTMGWASIADELFTIRQVASDQTFPDYVPEVTSLRTLFTRYLDFNAVPRRSFFQLLRHFITDELEMERLDEFCSEELADELYDYTTKVKRTIYEVMTEFRSARVPREYVFDLFPPMRPRQFSIASSVKRHPQEVHLCIAIVRYRTKLKVPRKGVCTSYLANLPVGSSIRIRIQRGLFTLPTDKSTPVICVGPGTGIAPMRAIIEERIMEGIKHNTLYFGCRSASKDQHYGSEWVAHAQDDQLVYRAAFSRDVPEGVKRPYVQDLLAQDKERLWTLIGERKGQVIISGSSNKMPAAVRTVLREVAERGGEMSAEDAAEYVSVMERDGRLVEECWS
ncbi:riboflavin synthase domain-like protein [Coniophora puteana RWD-64-598 SS2]|uniref:NADPH-dependent diflavin oxidoreductase 1 n=1 Tax=Coniophora puteana (strain RWD-64-598) TaxID=741705 RepID=A0A5M3M5Y7_CONPW|nr:riboflavin synthase domain-like protein [Coniophora puteana RWD-64-598 SS2]EIW74789.1 riboflavin synthase domain-like protein [Coniophora puteana RWD-64-598 SS2]